MKDAVGVKRKLIETEKRAAAAAQSLEEEKETTKRIRTERKQFYNLLRYQRKQTDELRQRIADIGDTDSLKLEHEQLWEEFQLLQEERDSLRSELDEKEEELESLRATADPVIKTQSPSGEYLPKFRRLIYKLLGNNIPHRHISSTISAVLEFAERKPSDLPTNKSISRMNIERIGVAHQHIAVSNLFY